MLAVLATALCCGLTGSCGGDALGPPVDLSKGRSAAIGDPCPQGTECRSGSFCDDDPDYPQGYCTKNCSTGGDCPDGSACVKDGERTRCLAICDGPRGSCAAPGARCLDGVVNHVCS